MKTFHITLGKGLDVDVLKLVESRVGICTNSGGGKSHLMRLLVEQIAGRIPVHILDWEGEYRTLRDQIDMVYVAKGGDLAPQVSTASKLAHKLLEKRVSAVLDMSSMTRVNRLNFVGAYIEGLLDVPASLWTPVLVFLDEAHRVCPEVASKGGGKELVSAIHRSRAAVIALMDSGRKRSIGGVLASQRLAKVAKDAFGEINNLFSGRFSQDIDLKRVGEHLGLDAGDREGLKAFKPGDFFAQGEAINHNDNKRARFRAFDTKTRAPKSGEKLDASQPSRTVKKILEELATLPQEVEKEIKDLKDAKTEIAKLQRELKAKPKIANAEEFHALKVEVLTLRKRLSKQQPSKELLADAEARGAEQVRKALEREQKTNRVEFDKELRHLWAQVQMHRKFNEDLAALHERLGKTYDNQPVPVKLTLQQLANKAVAIEKQFPNEDILVKTRPRSNGKLPFSWRSATGKLFSVLLQYHPEELEQRRVASLAGINPNSSTYRGGMAKLRAYSFVEGMAVTELGLEHRDDVEPLPAGAELIEKWRTKLGGVTLDMFNELVVAGGALPKESFDFASSTIRGAAAKLRRFGLLEPGDRGEDLKLAEHVMEAMQ